MATARAAVKKKASKDNVEGQKQDLEQQMEDSRESIAHTVADIKEAVVGEYESIKQGISETFDWREQFRKHPVAWMVGALSVGYVVGNSIASAYSGTKSNDPLLSYLGALGDKFTDELAKQGMNILTPALTGTILVPILTSQLREAFGIDLSDLPKQLLSDIGPPKGKKGKLVRKKSQKKAKGNGKSKG